MNCTSSYEVNYLGEALEYVSTSEALALGGVLVCR